MAFQSIAKYWLRQTLLRLRKVSFSNKKTNHTFTTSSEFWENNYIIGGGSGNGSYGRLAAFKAGVLNCFIRLKNIESIIELGCGDGNQLRMASYPSYLGIDVSQKAIAICQDLFSRDNSKHFLHAADFKGATSELTLSLDVIYHLVEDDTFNAYMNTLFMSAERYVVIYSTNFEDKSWHGHVRHRHFTEWIAANKPEWELSGLVENIFPEGFDNGDCSNADFYFYVKTD